MWIGWGIFVALIVEVYSMAAFKATGLFVISVVLWFAWWAIDVMNQELKPWQIVTGIAMLVIGLLPYGAVLIVACWVIYTLQVRE